MALDNVTAFSGNLVRDPEIKYTGGGKAMCRFSVAVNQKGYDGGEDRTHFIDVTAFGQLAENLVDSVRKGDRVSVQGRLDFQQWETSDGEKRTKLGTLADDVAVSLKWGTVGAGQKTSGSSRKESAASAPAAAAPADPNEAPF